MRKLVVSVISSLDGFVEGPDRDVLALPMDNSFDTYCAERLAVADTLLLGRRTYELFRGYWPTVAGREAATPAERDISRRENAIRKLVVTDAPLDAAASAPWTDSTDVVPRAQAAARVRQLKQGQGGDILVFGSRTAWTPLLRHALIDELHLMIGPVVLGDGTPIFVGGQAPVLQLLDTRSFDDSSNVLLRYAVRG